MKIDLFAHVCPQKFIDAFAKTKRGLRWEDVTGDARIQGGPVLWDMEKRLAIMDRYDFPEDEIHKYEIYKEIIKENVEMIKEVVSDFHKTSRFNKISSLGSNFIK